MPANPPPRSLADHAAGHIRRQIVTGHFKLGAALSETALAGALGISKTPVREALARLATEGLVVIQPQRGTFVFRMDAAEARRLSEFREVLEVAALRLAMRKHAAGLAQALNSIVVGMTAALAGGDGSKYRELDALYHECIVERCGNHYLARSYALIAFRIQALRYRLGSKRTLDIATLKQHRLLADLVARGMKAKAVALLRKHIADALAHYEKAAGSGAQTPPDRRVR